jgi:iron complex transport system substrate-binding protein
VAAKVRGATKKPKVFYELDATDPTKPFTPGPGTFIDALIAMAGGQNIAADAKAQWAQLSLEDVIKKDPELIILGDANYGTTPDQVKARPGWSAISAVKNGAIFGIDDNLVTRPGPRIAAGLETLAKIIQPELFKNP